MSIQPLTSNGRWWLRGRARTFKKNSINSHVGQTPPNFSFAVTRMVVLAQQCFSYRKLLPSNGGTRSAMLFISEAPAIYRGREELRQYLCLSFVEFFRVLSKGSTACIPTSKMANI
jgi:hypothetical protein